MALYHYLPAKAEGGPAMDKIVLSFNGHTYPATLADDPSAQAFAKLRTAICPADDPNSIILRNQSHCSCWGHHIRQRATVERLQDGDLFIRNTPINTLYSIVYGWRAQCAATIFRAGMISAFPGNLLPR